MESPILPWSLTQFLELTGILRQCLNMAHAWGSSWLALIRFAIAWCPAGGMSVPVPGIERHYLPSATLFFDLRWEFFASKVVLSDPLNKLATEGLWDSQEKQCLRISEHLTFLCLVLSCSLVPLLESVLLRGLWRSQPGLVLHRKIKLCLQGLSLPRSHYFHWKNAYHAWNLIQETLKHLWGHVLVGAFFGVGVIVLGFFLWCWKSTSCGVIQPQSQPEHEQLTNQGWIWKVVGKSQEPSNNPRSKGVGGSVHALSLGVFVIASGCSSCCLISACWCWCSSLCCWALILWLVLLECHTLLV